VLNPQQLSAQSASEVQGPVMNWVPAAMERDTASRRYQHSHNMRGQAGGLTVEEESTKENDGSGIFCHLNE
jgi:hypothetical protein